MMCEEAELRLAEMLTGEARDAEVERHLVDCESCRRDFELARAGWQAASELPAPKPAATLVQRVRQKIAGSRGGTLFFRIGTAAAAAVILALLVLPTPKAAPVRKETPRAKGEPTLAFVDGGIGSLMTRDLEGRPRGELSIGRHAVQAEILDGIAKTTVEEVFVNDSDRRLEGTFYFPLPTDASISRLAMEIDGQLMEGTVLERERAREVYEGIVRQMKDPALLEWMPGGIFKCRIFPIEPRSEKRIVLAYTQALAVRDGHMKYVYPLASEKARENSLGHVTVDVAVRSSAKMRSIDCASHRIDVAKKDAHEARGRYEARNLRPTNDFVLEVHLEDPAEFVLVPHKVDGEDGYFMACYTPQGGTPPKRGKTAIVVDVSASVTKPELDASRAMAEAVLDRTDSFVLFAHHVEARRFAGSKRDALLWLSKLETGGGCDLKRALDAAVAEHPDEIFYIGEGVPTMGEETFDLAFDGLFRAVAVGRSGGTLAELAQKHGGIVHTISQGEHVPSRVREIAATLETPIVKDLAVEATQEIYDLAPAGRRNVLDGDRVVVTGRYRGSEGTLAIAGCDFRMALPVKEERNNYVKRLWAQRKIADWLAQGEAKRTEVVACSVQNQIMTPYTSFLVLENEQAYVQYAIRREKREEDGLFGLRDAPQDRPATGWVGQSADRGEWGRLPGYFENDVRLDFNQALAIEVIERTVEKLQKNPDGMSTIALFQARVASVEELRITLDAGAKRGFSPGMLFAITRDRRFVAVIHIQHVTEDTAVGTVWQGIAVGPIRPGDDAGSIDDPTAYLQSLPVVVRQDLASCRNVDRIRGCVEDERAMRSRR